MSLGTGKHYKPLTQTMTDSDSEFENLVGRNNCPKVPNTSKSDDHSSKNLTTIDGLSLNLTFADSTTVDNESFLEAELLCRMSFTRRCVFFLSITICLSVIVIFLWGIPCSDKSCSIQNFEYDSGWEFPYQDIELSGAIQVVNGVIANSKNLIFIYRGNHIKESIEAKDGRINGVLLIVGKTGKVGWYTREDRIPTDINCNLIDINGDNQKDCIVSGTDGLLAALDPLSGTYHWYKHKQGEVFSNIVALDFPVLLKDMDNDGMSELLTVATVYPSTNHNTLVVISGVSGDVIGEPVIIEDCLTVKILSESDIINVAYLCKNGTTEAVRIMSYTTLYRSLMRTDSMDQISFNTDQMKKIKVSLKKTVGNTREIFTNGAGKLVIENSGLCPDSCRVNLKMLLEKNGHTNVSWEYSANHVYAMRPSSFSFANQIRGYIIKL